MVAKDKDVCKIQSGVRCYLFSIGKSCTRRVCPTKRAPDAGDSAQIPSIFLRLSIFLVGRLRRPPPQRR